MKTKVMQLAVLLVIGSFCTVSMAAGPADASQAIVPGKFPLPVYLGSTLAEKRCTSEYSSRPSTSFEIRGW
jgi:hypothetical protein